MNEANSHNYDVSFMTYSPKLINIKRYSIPIVQSEFVKNKLNFLDISKATGLDNINTKYLKLLATVIAPILTHINFKVAKALVIPIRKNRVTCEKSKSRPISILPIIFLILEKHIIYLL